jgi:hypothetical protein
MCVFLSISLGTKLTNGKHLSEALFSPLFCCVYVVTWKALPTEYSMLCQLHEPSYSENISKIMGRWQESFRDQQRCRTQAGYMVVTMVIPELVLLLASGNTTAALIYYYLYVF